LADTPWNAHSSIGTGEGIVQRRLDSVKIAEQADQGGKNLQCFGAVEGGAGHGR